MPDIWGYSAQPDMITEVLQRCRIQNGKVARNMTSMSVSGIEELNAKRIQPAIVAGYQKGKKKKEKET